jgi:hypothetical protein
MAAAIPDNTRRSGGVYHTLAADTAGSDIVLAQGLG